jgi:23S rRNA pseudouridine1911/1915/1917 synthase
MDKAYRFTADEGGVRLDKYVGEKCPELSRTYAQKLIADGLIRVNGGVVKAGFRLSAGDRVDVVIPPAAPSTLSPEAMSLDILYEDDDLLVVNKPPGLAVHPAPGLRGHTLLNAILFHFPHLADIGQSLRPGVVHRLDKDTSGVMLVAKNGAAQANLVDQFKNRAVVKVYMALVKGRLTPEDGIIEAPLGRDSRNRKRMAVVGEGRGREARTRYHVVKYTDGYTLLEVSPETGRTHQIRVHLKAIGYPVVGDPVYGVKSEHLARQFLHACRLGFRLPSTGEYVEFTAELPPDLTQALEAVG